MFEPEYVITPIILSHIAEIAEIKATVERSRVLPLNEAQLRRQAILRMAHTSTSIEGNRLAQFEVGKVFEGKRVSAPPKDILEVENYLNGLKLLDELSKTKKDLTMEEILKLHQTIIDGLVDKEKVGKIRPSDIYILDDLGGGKEMLRFKGPPAPKVTKLLGDLLEWLKKAKAEGIHPIIIAGIFHLEFVSIHPFTDGNGRVTRLLTQLLLYRLNWDFRKILVLEDYYNQNRLAYYNALHSDEEKEYKQGRQSTVWLEYFTTGFLVEARKVLEKIQSIGYGQVSKKSEQIFLDKDEIQIMDFLTTTGRITSDDVADILKFTKRAAQLKLKRLIQNKLIKLQGSGPGTYYVLSR
ncbi:MAG: Fic family protein [Candidatus Daviesbacteria bacterium]|nr:Fic family protein [Candidatus Daviesbacteria bacterium]